MRLLLCSDLDRTLLPNGDAPESPAARRLFARLAGDDGVTLVYVSGRDRDLIDDAVVEYGLPAPDVAISDVGAAIATRTPRCWREWEDWNLVLSRSWEGRRASDLNHLLADLPALTPQVQVRGHPFKFSYNFNLNGPADAAAAGAALVGAVSARLAAAGATARIIHSVDDVTGVGLLDVLPPAAGKRSAVEYVMGKLGFTLSQTIYAGDSGNDLDVLAGPVPSVLVANATPMVREEARRAAAAAGQTANLYLARGGVLGLNGNYAAGILEGLLHFQPQWAEVLEETS